MVKTPCCTLVRSSLAFFLASGLLLSGCGTEEIEQTNDTAVSVERDEQAFISPSGISTEEFTGAIADFVGMRVSKAVKNVQMDTFRSGLNDGMNAASEPTYSIEEMSTMLAMVEASQQDPEAGAYVPKDDETVVISYAMGFIQGTQIGQLNVAVDMDKFIDVFAQSYASGGIDPDESEQTIRAYLDELEEYNRAQASVKSGENMQKSIDFLAKNRDKAGVMETPSGLQYEVITDGEGTKPTTQDKVQVHYSGKLLNGEEFDSSYKNKQPAEFPLAAVIPGWTEGLQLMNVGSKYRFFIPPQLGYGERGSPPNIGPNELLVFEVELLKIL